jgi:hypothetical protein
MARKFKGELARLATTTQEQLARAEALGKSLDRRMKKAQDAAEDWTPNDEWRRDFATVTSVIKDCGAALQRALEGNEKTLGGMTTEQLEAQFNAEIIRSAQTLTEEQWQTMVAARAKRASKT